MAEPILDYDSFFEGAKSALLELDTLSTEEERLRAEGDRVTKAIEAEKKATEGRIAETRLKISENLWRQRRVRKRVKR